MKTLLIRGSHEPPQELRDIVRGGSTELVEVTRGSSSAPADVDRVVLWDGRDVRFEDRRLRWPDDKDELRMLFETGG